MEGRTKSLTGHHSDERDCDMLPKSPVSENMQNISEVDVYSSAGRLLGVVDDNSSGENVNLTFIEHLPFREEKRIALRGGFWKEEKPDDTETDGHDSFDQEQPLPASKSALPSQREDAGSDDAGKSLCANISEEESGVADGIFALLVPSGEVVQGTGDKTGFQGADEKPSQEECGSIGTEDLEGSDEAPKDDLCRDPNTGSNLEVSKIRKVKATRCKTIFDGISKMRMPMLRS